MFCSGHRFIVNNTVELGWAVGVLMNGCCKISYTEVLGSRIPAVGTRRSGRLEGELGC